MKNIEFMQIFQADGYIDESPPNNFLVELSVSLLVVDNFLVEVAVVRKLHDYTGLKPKVPKGVGLNEGVCVAYDVGAFD